MADYKKEKATKIFLLLKIVEILIVFILTFGIWELGNNYLKDYTPSCVIHSYVMGDFICPYIENPNMFQTWTIGLSLLIVYVLIILMGIAYILGIGLIITLFFLINWKWAVRLSETPEGRRKRLLKREEKLREEYTLLRGDVVRIKKNLKVGQKFGVENQSEPLVIRDNHKKFFGKLAKVTRADSDDTCLLDITKGDHWWHSDMLELVKKREVTK